MRIGTKTGETMHAMFSMNIRINKKSKRSHVKSLFPLLENVRLLIIDEISMTVSKFIFTIIYYVFQQPNNNEQLFLHPELKRLGNNP